MFPFIEVFGKTIGLNSIMVLCGLFASGINSCLMASKRKYNYIDIILFIIFLFIGIIIGSYFLYALLNFKNIIYVFENINKINILNNLFNVLAYVFGGSVFYGGLIGGIITGYILIKKQNKYKLFVDIVVVNIPLFHFFGRIGCFLGGCCFGIPSKIGFIYKVNPIIEANYIKRFPVQLLEATFNLILFFVLYFLYKKEILKNKLLYVYMFIYAFGRFFIEYLRGDSYRGIWWIFSTSQIISFLIFITLVFYFIYNKTNDKISAKTN